MMPFAGGLEATANGMLLFSVASACVYFFLLDTPVSLRRSVVKTIPVALLAGLVLLHRGPLLLAGALALSALGDAFLSRGQGEKAFLGGLASFLVAHLLYVALFAHSGGGLGMLLTSPRLLFGIIIAIFAIVMLAVLWPRVEVTLRLPIAVYVAAILAMGLAALTLPDWRIILGAMLFIASDALLATEKFLLGARSTQRFWMRHAVWALYYAAQALIALGFLMAP
ncbi:putative membrane protein YhhN [Mesorhizobium soli]|jgi:uncharacterized membrane protein YhhN|uniref:lysoplasmalogenase n=1 Tax=Pseudaminobacter soli (ex Li et al. 2025) TaxID=1295366 RepID=UPI002476377D|nr:lysoplasmalogenase [Mesorhizobium soli]MDH6234096.1 putative membrane protein YhhN [Mesorhizobium soli]